MAASQTHQSDGIDIDASLFDDVDLSELDGIGEAPRSNGSELSTDETFELLKNARRRAVLQYLLQNGGNAKLSELAEHIAAAENGISVHELSSDQRKRVYIGLYQCHLPKMDNLGVIEYEKNRGTVELQESVGQLLPYLQTGTRERSNVPPTYVLGIASGIAGVVLVGTLGLGPFALVPVVAWTILAIAGLLGIALLHVRGD